MTSTPPALPRRRPDTEVGQRSEPVSGTCPACGSRVRPEQPWCTLCHHRLGPGPVPAPDARPVPGPAPDPDPQPDPEPRPESAAEPAAPAVAGDPAAASSAEPALPVEVMLVELAAVERHSPVPPVLSQLLGTGPLGRFALGGAALVTVLTVLVGLFGLVGLFL